jgi:hypothetical protein
VPTLFPGTLHPHPAASSPDAARSGGSGGTRVRRGSGKLLLTPGFLHCWLVMTSVYFRLNLADVRVATPGLSLPLPGGVRVVTCHSRGMSDWCHMDHSLLYWLASICVPTIPPTRVVRCSLLAVIR